MKPQLSSENLRPHRLRDRRRSPRIDVADRLRGTIAGSDVAVRVLDISFGGCLVESAEPFSIGSLHQFQLETLDCSIALTITARVAHSRRDSPAAPHSLYVSGFRIVGPHGREAAMQYARLIDAVTSVLTFD